MNYRNSKKLLLVVFLAILQIQLYAQYLTIACASNFREPMEIIAQEYEKEYPGFKVKTVYGSSGNLYHQITNKAPFDIFLSADKTYPDKLYEGGFSYRPPIIYALGQLVMWSKKVDVSKGLAMLNRGSVKKIAVANTDLAPYGRSTKECLMYYNMYENLKGKLVVAENIAQAAQFAVTGNVDVAFMAKSQLYISSIKGKGSYFEITRESYLPIEQAFVLIKKEGNQLPAQKFVAFMAKPEIRQIIINFGYLLPNE